MSERERERERETERERERELLPKHTSQGYLDNVPNTV